MSLRNLAIRVGALALVVGATAPLASASHFRFGHITWVNTPGGGPNTVDITVTAAWRATVFEGIPLSLSDGASMCFNIPGGIGCAPGIVMTDLGTFADLAGEMYTIGSGTWTHTFPGEGPWTASAGSCCRIGSLVNAGSASWSISTTIDLRGGNTGSPVSSIPVILQVPVNTLWSQALPIADPDQDPVTCAEATMAQSSIPSTPMIGANPLTVDNTCTLNWDTNGGIVGDKYAYQVRILENHPGGAAGDIVLDFILEMVTSPPTCMGGGNFVVTPGQNLNVNFTGTDPDGDDLTLLVQGIIPPGATFSPPVGTTSASPFNVRFDWTPGPGDVNTAFAMSIIFEDPIGLQGVCALGVTVPDAPIFIEPTCGEQLDVSALQEITFDVTAEANTDEVGEFVTLDVVGALPPGATTLPGLPVMGQPASTTFSWTPDIVDIGTHVVTFIATDQLGQETECDVTIEVAECFLLLGNGRGSDIWTPMPGGYVWNTQLSGVDEFYPVLINDNPSFPLSSFLSEPVRPFRPNGAAGLQSKGGGILQVENFTVQVLMYNPLDFPGNPEQSSNGLDVSVWSTGHVLARSYGANDGMEIGVETLVVDGQLHVRFPFTIEGF